MSGGALDYVCFKVDDAADRISSKRDSALYTAFADHLRLVSNALHAIEWSWSGDTSGEDVPEKIRAVISPDDELGAAIEIASKVLIDLEETINYAERSHED